MQLTPELLYMGIVINRLVELFKEALPPEDSASALDRWRTMLILLASFFLGALGVVALFPASNLFLTAATPLAGQVFTGIVVAAIANGIDFAAGLGESVIKRVQNPPASSSVSVKASVAAEQTEIKSVAA